MGFCSSGQPALFVVWCGVVWLPARGRGCVVRYGYYFAYSRLFKPLRPHTIAAGSTIPHMSFYTMSITLWSTNTPVRYVFPRQLLTSSRSRL